MIAYVHTIVDYGMNVRHFWNNKNIFSYFTVNVTVKIKQVENGLYNGITHVNNLRAIFSEEHISMP